MLVQNNIKQGAGREQPLQRRLTRFRLSKYKRLRNTGCGSTDLWDHSDHCLPHQCFGLELFIPPINLSCFAWKRLCSTRAAVGASEGVRSENPLSERVSGQPLL